MNLIAVYHNKRTYFFSDYDDAMSFARFFDGDVSYLSTGYKVTI